MTVLLVLTINSVTATAAAGRAVYETEIDAGIDEVWAAFTTKEGLELWRAPLVEVRFAVGGTVKINYNAMGSIGDATTAEYSILAYDPKRMISLRPTKFPVEVPFAEAAIQTWSVYYFSPVSPMRTKVTVVGLGFKDDAPSRQWRAMYDAVTQGTLEKLGKALKQPTSTTADGTLLLKGHSGPIFCVAFSPDGGRLASAGDDRIIRVWDISRARVELSLRGHTGEVTSVAFSPDGKRIATGAGGLDGTLRIWDAKTGTLELTISVRDLVSRVFFSSDGKRVLTAGSDITIWDSTTGNSLLTISQPGLGLGVAWSPDGKRIAGGTLDGEVKVWDATTGREQMTLPGRHTDRVVCIAFSPDGRRIATGSGDKTVKVWEATHGEELVTLKGHTGRVAGVAFSPDGKQIASCSMKVKVWDTVSGRERRQWAAGAKGAFTVTFSPDGTRVAAGSFDTNIYLWALEATNKK